MTSTFRLVRLGLPRRGSCKCNGPSLSTKRGHPLDVTKKLSDELSRSETDLFGACARAAPFLRHRHASKAIEGRIRSFSRSWNRTGHVGNPRRRRGRRIVASQAHLVVVVFELAGAGGACVAPSTSPGVFGETKEENLRWNTRLKWRRWRET